MGKYLIHGGNRISGKLNISGGKNAVLPILAATVLNGNVSVIENCPKISDTFLAIEILKSIGCKVTVSGSTITVDSSSINNFEVPEHPVREMRSSIIFLGSILSRFGKVKISYPGGCELGSRPIDLHLKGIQQLGAKIKEEFGYIICETETLIGTHINLDFPSVGATQNIMLLAVYAQGETIMSNVAKEPEIIDLQEFLNSMGAKVTGAGTDTIVIQGVKKLRSATHKVMPDRIVAGTYLIAAAITGGEIELQGIVPKYMYPITSKLAEAGCKMLTEQNKIRLAAPTKLKAIEKIKTLPHPGFPTDMQSQFAAMLSICEGSSIIEETIFEARNKHIPELIRMGANISLLADGSTALIKGVSSLQGATVIAKDLRGGAALVLAGLIAEGKTIVENSHFIERGYEHIHSDLRTLGASIELIKD